MDITLEQALDSWTIDLRSRNCAKRTIETYTLAVVQFRDHLKNRHHSLRVGEITPTDVRGFIGWMLEKKVYRPCTR